LKKKNTGKKKHNVFEAQGKLRNLITLLKNVIIKQ